VVPEITETVAAFLKGWGPQVDAIVPVPPSNTRRKHQPVIALAHALSQAIGVPVCEECVTKVKSTAQLKDVFDYAKRSEILTGAFGVDAAKTSGKRLLLVDDLYRSGATVSTIAKLLLTAGARARGVLANLNADAQTRMTRLAGQRSDKSIARLQQGTLAAAATLLTC